MTGIRETQRSDSLFSGGLIPSYFVKKKENILTSWFMHISTGLALIIFGFWMLELLL